MEQYIPKSALVAGIEKLYNGEIDIYTRNILDRLKSNIDTLEVKEFQEEPVSEDLEKACEKYTDERLKIIRPDIYDSSYSRSTKMTFDLFEGYELETAFEEGANWQKEQMMKDAIEAEIINWASMFTSIKVIEPERAEAMIKEKFDIGDKVKLIIVKEE